MPFPIFFLPQPVDSRDLVSSGGSVVHIYTTEKSRRGENGDKEADAEQVAWKGQVGD